MFPAVSRLNAKLGSTKQLQALVLSEVMTPEYDILKLVKKRKVLFQCHCKKERKVQDIFFLFLKSTSRYCFYSFGKFDIIKGTNLSADMRVQLIFSFSLKQKKVHERVSLHERKLLVDVE